jgi:hypothetical protein
MRLLRVRVDCESPGARAGTVCMYSSFLVCCSFLTLQHGHQLRLMYRWTSSTLRREGQVLPRVSPQAVSSCKPATALNAMLDSWRCHSKHKIARSLLEGHCMQLLRAVALLICYESTHAVASTYIHAAPVSVANPKFMIIITITSMLMVEKLHRLHRLCITIHS